MIKLKNKNEIAVLREGGHRLAQILRKLIKEVKPGVDTGYLEELTVKLIIAAGGRPAFKDYDMGDGLFFPSALCASINNEVVHGSALPPRVLKSGDIIDLDIGMQYPADGGLYTDTCATVGVGKITKEAKKLITVTRECLLLGIKQAKPGNTLNDIGRAIARYAMSYGYGVVRDLVGHGVGHSAHEEPNVFNYEIGAGHPDNLTLEPGLVIAIEPMINLGTWKVKIGGNGYTVLTADNSLSAHFEHSIVITEKGCEILTI